MKKIMMNRLSLLFCAAGISLFVAAPAKAGAKKQFCKDYAHTAVWHYKQSIKFECHFQSPYFHPARGLHKLWCMGQPRSVAIAGNIKRAEMLSLCQAQGEN